MEPFDEAILLSPCDEIRDVLVRLTLFAAAQI